MSPARPRIVITASRGDAVAEYVDAVREAGADAIRVEPGDAARAALDDADGLLITGGVDVDPAAYRGAASPFVTATEPERDVFEIEALHAARELDLPVLAICRGLQVANVAFGGTLLPDIPAALGTRAGIPHRAAGPHGRSERGVLPLHVVRIDEDSALAAIVGRTELATGGRHHQAVDRCAGDLRVVASTADGVVEALEARFASPFWLAVQWHPESTREADGGASRAIFAAFVDAARHAAAPAPPG